MRVGLTSVCAVGLFALILVGIAQGDDAKRPAGLLPVVRFYDHDTDEHMYSLQKEELEQWRGLLHFKEHEVVGCASPVELPDTVRLWRAVHRTGRHYYYLRTSNKPGLTVESEKFHVYVWKKPGDGRIPIYAHTWTDGGDVFFSGDMDHIRKFKETSFKALGVNRLPLQGRDIGMPMFYLYPPLDEEKAAAKTESKDTATKEKSKSE